MVRFAVLVFLEVRKKWFHSASDIDHVSIEGPGKVKRNAVHIVIEKKINYLAFSSINLIFKWVMLLFKNRMEKGLFFPNMR